MGKSDKTRIEALQRQIREEALSWEKTPYHPLAHVKGAGCDCVGLLAGVFENVGVVEPVKMPHYSPQWHLHNNRSILQGEIVKYADEVSDETPRTGDIMLFEYGKTYAHSAIILDWPMAIHANLKARAVVRVNVEQDEHLSRCKRVLYRPKVLIEREG